MAMQSISERYRSDVAEADKTLSLDINWDLPFRMDRHNWQPIINILCIKIPILYIKWEVANILGSSSVV